MFYKSLRHDHQTRRYSIAATATGWEVREERDSEVVKKVEYHDWHRVERALAIFRLEVSELTAGGWSEVH